MGHKFEAKNKHKLDNEERRRILPPRETLEKVGLRQGDIIADVGCGIGYFTIPAAQIVGSGGKVYAMDILPEMLMEVEKKKTEMSLPIITTIVTEENKLKIAEDSVTLAFICNVLHETQNVLSFLSEVKRIVSDNGRVAIIEWNKIESDFGPPLSHRLAKEYVAELLQNSGFRNVQSVDLGDCFYAVLGQR